MVASGPCGSRIIPRLVTDGVPRPRIEVSEGISNFRASHERFGVSGETKD
jgi:hypothetical protein